MAPRTLGIEPKTSIKMKLTERSVADAIPVSLDGISRQRIYLDSIRRGFCLSVSAKGVKSYFVMRHVGGKQVRFVFGHPGELTVAEARVQAEQHLAKMAMGENPVQKRDEALQEAKRAKIRGITLGEALTNYESHLKAKQRSKLTLADYRRHIESYLSAWIERPLIERTRTECRERHAAIANEVARGKYANKRKRGEGFGKLAANKAMRAFRAVYNHAAVEHPDLPAQITASVNWNAENRRTSVVKANDLPTWFKKVNAETNTVRRDYLLFVLFTGLRYTNAAEVELEHVNLKRRSLLIPKPKSGRPFELPLSDVLMKLLKGRIEENKKLAPDSPYVFPASMTRQRKKNKDGTKKGPQHIVETRIEGIHTTTHDLRRTFITIAESLDISPYAIKLLVNHSLPKSDVTGGYVIPELERMRDPMQRIADHIMAMASGKKKSSTRKNIS